jgi:hypothetical protein
MLLVDTYGKDITNNIIKIQTLIIVTNKGWCSILFSNISSK